MPLGTHDAPAAATGAPPSKFVVAKPFEAPDDLEHMLASAFASIQPALSNRLESFAHERLQERASEGSSQHFEVVCGLLYGILTDAPNGPKFVGLLSSITRDGHAGCMSVFQRIVVERWKKLHDGARTQILWMVRQFIGMEVGEIEAVCYNLLRQIASGDLSHGNVWLAGQMLEILRSNLDWLYNNPSLLTTSLYTFLRLLPDHAMSKTFSLAELKSNEISFCVRVLRERFQDCLMIGRDLIRLLQDVASIPEFESVWRDLLSDPSAFRVPAFEDLAQLYVVRTPSRYLLSRITPEMESQIRFLLTHVRMGNQVRYQKWFAERFLSGPESETLVCDIIRFICGVVHPTNQILQSDICPRWAVLGWLLKCCKNPHAEANAKLSIFFDWFFFMTKSDNIMNIEPAILLMVHSIPKYVDMTNSLLEFLFLLIENYDPARRDLILRGVGASVNLLVTKGVVHSLEPLASHPLILQPLRDKLRDYFPSYCKPELSPSSLVNAAPANPSPSLAPPASASKPISAPFVNPVKSTKETARIPPPYQAHPSSDTQSDKSFAKGKDRDAEFPNHSRAKDESIALEPESKILKERSRSSSFDTDSLKDTITTAIHSEESDLKKVHSVPITASPSVEQGKFQISGTKRKRDGEGSEGTKDTMKLLLSKLLASKESEEKSFSLLQEILSTYLAMDENDALESESSPSRPKLRILEREGPPNGRLSEPMTQIPYGSNLVLAQELADALSNSALPFFSPLPTVEFFDSLEKDEMGSIDSTLLNMYVNSHYHSRHVLHPHPCHPHLKLHRLFLAWQSQGLTIGARLLCHVSCMAKSFHGSHGTPAKDEKRGPRIGSSDAKKDGPDGPCAPLHHDDEPPQKESREVKEKVKEELNLNESAQWEERISSNDSASTSSKNTSSCNYEFRLQREKNSGLYRVKDQEEIFLAFELYESFLDGWMDLLTRGSNSNASGKGDTGATPTKDNPSPSATSLLLADLQYCFLCNINLLLSIFPFIFHYLPHRTCGKEEILRLLFSVIDPSSMAEYESRIILQEFRILGSNPESTKAVLSSAMSDWDTCEQQWLWRLMAAESYDWPLSSLLSLLSTASSQNKHWSVLSSVGMSSVLKTHPPSVSLLSSLLKLPSFCDVLVVTVLSSWSVTHGKLLTSLLKRPELKTRLEETNQKNGFVNHDSNASYSSGGGSNSRYKGCKLFIEYLEKTESKWKGGEGSVDEEDAIAAGNMEKPEKSAVIIPSSTPSPGALPPSPPNHEMLLEFRKISDFLESL